MTIHPTAKCCWCLLALVNVDGIWWCQTEACRQKQREHGIGVSAKKGGGWKWLYVPTPKQVVFDACPAKYILFGGAAGPGKSHAVRWALYRRCLRQPGYEAVLLRKTFPELEKTHLRRMANDAPLIGAEFIESKRLMKFPNGSLIECGHMDDEAGLQKWLSTEYHAIVPDEGSTFDPDRLLELSTRARRVSPDGTEKGKFWVVSNPGGPASSMLLDFFIDHEPDFEKYPKLRPVFDKEGVQTKGYRSDQWAYIPALLDDNPYLDEDYDTALAVLQPWRYEQLRHGDWRVFSGQFFATWNTRRHIKELEPSREARWFRSLDWGRNAPGCVLWWAVLPDNRLYLRAEWKFQGMDEYEVATGIKKKDKELGLSKITYTVVDPSIRNKTGASHKDGQFTGQFIAETLGHYGVPCIGGDNDRKNGWTRCAALLRDAPDGEPWFMAHPDCRYFARTIAAAVSDPKDPEDVDTTTDDHALDAWRYGAMSRPHPLGTGKAHKRFAPGTMGHLRQSVGKVFSRLGSESVRAS